MDGEGKRPHGGRKDRNHRSRPSLARQEKSAMGRLAMRQHLIAATAVLLGLAAPALAEEQSPADAPAQVAPNPGTADSSAGDVTAPGREHLPDDTTEAAVAPEEHDGAAPEVEPAAGSSRAVSAGMVKELHEMGLEQQKRAATPPVKKTEEQMAAAKKAIAAHRDAFFARVEERL
jgi:hypothetical protein